MRDCGFSGPYSIAIEGTAEAPELALAEYITQPRRRECRLSADAGVF